MGGQKTDWGRSIPFEKVEGEVAIVGVGEADHSKASGRTAEEIGAQAIERAIEDAGLAPEEIDGVCFSGGMGARFDAKCFHEHFGTSHAMFESAQGGGMVWAATAPAARRTRRCAAARRASTSSTSSRSPGPQTGLQHGRRGRDRFHAAERIKRNLELPFGWFPQPVYFATIARRHMFEYGTRRRSSSARSRSAAAATRTSTPAR